MNGHSFHVLAVSIPKLFYTFFSLILSYLSICLFICSLIRELCWFFSLAKYLVTFAKFSVNSVVSGDSGESTWPLTFFKSFSTNCPSFSSAKKRFVSNSSSHRRCFVKNICFKKFCNIQRETTVLESLFNKAACLQTCSFIKRRLQHGRFPVNIAKFLRTPTWRTSTNGCVWFDKKSYDSLQYLTTLLSL